MKSNLAATIILTILAMGITELVWKGRGETLAEILFVALVLALFFAL